MPKWTKALGAALLVLALTSACSSESTSDNSTRDDEGNITEGGDVGVFALEVGDCFNQPPSGDISEVAGVPCTDAHDNEVFATFDMEGGDDAAYPGDAAVQTASEDCIGELFTTYVGLTYQESRFEVFPITPTQDTWESDLNDREIICTANAPAPEQVTGSIKDTAE
jgi:hypothetical protein